MAHAHVRQIRLPRLGLLVVVLAVLVAADLVTFVYLDRPGGPLNPRLDQISSVTWERAGTTLSSGPGFKAHFSSQVTLTLTDTNCLAGCPPIDLSSATVVPSAFTVVGVSLPVIAPGATENLTVTVGMPSGPYSGPLTIDLS